MTTSVMALLAVLVFMVGELALSRRNERILRARGAVEPPDPVYRTMQWAYPGAFVAMAIEGAVAGVEPDSTTVAGAFIFLAGKLLKFWAVATLGERWTFRVLVEPRTPLATGGPYRLMRHPNYVGVAGELVGMALITQAPWTGTVGTAFFFWLLWRRIQVEERALAGLTGWIAGKRVKRSPVKTARPAKRGKANTAD